MFLSDIDGVLCHAKFVEGGGVRDSWKRMSGGYFGASCFLYSKSLLFLLDTSKQRILSGLGVYRWYAYGYLMDIVALILLKVDLVDFLCAMLCLLNLSTMS